jgi:hypothetical protein
MGEDLFLLSNNRPIFISILMIALISNISLPMTSSLSLVSLLHAVFQAANTFISDMHSSRTAESGLNTIATKEWLKTGSRYKVHYLKNDMK